MSNASLLKAAQSKFHARAVDLVTAAVENFSHNSTWKQAPAKLLRARLPEDAWTLAGHVLLLGVEPPSVCFEGTPLRFLAGAGRGEQADLLQLLDGHSAWVRSARRFFDPFEHLHRIAVAIMAIELLIRADPGEGLTRAGVLVHDHLSAFRSRFFEAAPGFSLPVPDESSASDAVGAQATPERRRDSRHIMTGLLLDGLHISFANHRLGIPPITDPVR